MKLLFDQNLSPQLALRLADLFPGSAHVDPVGLGTAEDNAVWDFALAHDFTIVSKDEDFNLLSVARGHPPKVIWLLLGNCTTQDVEDAIRSEQAVVQSFGNDALTGTLIIR
jgi:predicted nuclease of predicted toxin-antitoxin system